MWYTGIDKTSNFGTLDIIEALKWVKKNIQNFGGDPNNITDELVTRWHDLLIRKGQRDAQIARVNQYVSGDIDQVLSGIKSPALIMWGKKNNVVPVALAHEMKNMMEKEMS